MKCDEQKPSCHVCLRHGVGCLYTTPKPYVKTSTPGAASSHSLPQGERSSSSLPSLPGHDNDGGASSLELRLFHYFISHTRHGLRETDEFWGIRARLIAFEYRTVFDAMLALAALHMYRQILDNTFIFDRSSAFHNSQNAWTLHGRFLAGRSSREIYEAYMHYFDSAVKGQRSLIQEADLRAAYVVSALISVISLVSLGLDVPEELRSKMQPATSYLWFTLAMGPRELVPLWIQRSGVESLRETGVYDDEPDFKNVEELFDPKHALLFEDLLTFGAEFETITEAESVAYQQALSYIGLIYANLVGRLEEPLVTSRRYVALPGRVPPAFSDTVLQQRPRALAILAHAFATMRLLEAEVPWYRGIAAKQVPCIAASLPPAWQKAMNWPLAMLLVSASERGHLPDLKISKFRLATR